MPNARIWADENDVRGGAVVLVWVRARWGRRHAEAGIMRLGNLSFDRMNRIYRMGKQLCISRKTSPFDVVGGTVFHPVYPVNPV
jgi:hypothetical protein